MNPEAPQHECAVIGILSTGEQVSNNLYYGLQAMQNRGQEGSGIATFNSSGDLRYHKRPGLVNSVYDQDAINYLDGDVGVGHNRYGTTGSPSEKNLQPFIVDSDIGRFAFVHNGNVFNAGELRKDLESEGERFESTSDSEVIARLVAIAPGRSFVEKMKNAAPHLQGAYTLLLGTPNEIIGMRDPRGTWPLSLGHFNSHGYILASETNGIEKAGGKFIRDVENGEIVTVSRTGIKTDRELVGTEKESLCSFEYYYFGDPYSKYLGRRVEGARFDMGKILSKEYPVSADWVVPIPETARPAGEGYAFDSKVPIRGALVRNRWMGRTFIEPDQWLRELGAGLKYGPLSEVVEDSKLIVVDDSIVRGTTTRKTIGLIREAGAKEVHLRITAPPVIEQCYLGIDTADKDELIANLMNTDSMANYLGVDSLGYLSLKGGIEAIGSQFQDRLCFSCFTGKYDMVVPERRDKFILEGVK